MKEKRHYLKEKSLKAGLTIQFHMRLSERCESVLHTTEQTAAYYRALVCNGLSLKMFLRENTMTLFDHSSYSSALDLNA